MVKGIILVVNLGKRQFYGNTMELLDRIAHYFSKKENRGYALGGMFAGGFYSADLLSAIKDFWAIFTLAFLLKGIMGLGYIAMGGAATKMGAIFVEMMREKIKTFKNGKQKNDQRRA